MKTENISHTPGPWLVIRPGENGHTKLRVGKSHGKTVGGGEMVGAIADICISRRIDFKGDISPEEQGNAQLIAAAPDLLVALKEIGSRLDRWASVGISRGQSGKDADWPTLTTQVHDAIAKAEGRSA